jgi:hypothetical protein
LWVSGGFQSRILAGVLLRPLPKLASFKTGGTADGLFLEEDEEFSHVGW